MIRHLAKCHLHADISYRGYTPAQRLHRSHRGPALFPSWVRVLDYLTGEGKARRGETGREETGLGGPPP
ncbi:hypothetical protein E2C01_074744 [Portunus trituberculatus]|uniref:Uncharacterized protein n=1 Tax=Portunus trituberculatus TaxID=210409 RepID=A0A5B7II15_PORTR|nr:hypothetical protein [Portunus trituberculatus]